MKPGDVFCERYRLDAPLARGGMSTLWAATHLVTERRVALKFAKVREGDASAKKRALREARAAAWARHENIVPVHDVLEAPDGAPVLVMDLLLGESLDERLRREKTISVETTCFIAREVLSALDAAHAAHIVHRDLKPANIFLERSGRVVVLDFGIAKWSGHTALSPETQGLTDTGAMLGTPHYMAPEQAFGDASIDGRADLWSLGAVMYECLVGAPPLTGTNVGQLLKSLAMGDFPSVRERRPDLPPHLGAFIDSLLANEPSERPASARDARMALDAPAPEVRRVAARRRWRVPAIAVGAAASCALVISFARAVPRAWHTAPRLTLMAEPTSAPVSADVSAQPIPTGEAARSLPAPRATGVARSRALPQSKVVPAPAPLPASSFPLLTQPPF